MALSIVYTTLPARDAAVTLARDVVSQQLVACANIIPGMTSVYRWKGELEESEEVILLLKTQTELVPQVMQAVKSLHPYETPCILSWNLDAAGADFENWVISETAARMTGNLPSSEFEV
jgi:periplasmic divalent cation tolerance protein